MHKLQLEKSLTTLNEIDIMLKGNSNDGQV